MSTYDILNDCERYQGARDRVSTICFPTSLAVLSDPDLVPVVARAAIEVTK